MEEKDEILTAVREGFAGVDGGSGGSKVHESAMKSDVSERQTSPSSEIR